MGKTGQHLGDGGQHLGDGEQHLGGGEQHLGGGEQHLGGGEQHLESGEHVLHFWHLHVSVVIFLHTGELVHLGGVSWRNLIRVLGFLGQQVVQ